MTVLSTLRVSKSDKEVMDRKKAARGTSPAIDFYEPQVAEGKSEEDGKLKDKDQYRKFDVPLNLSNTESDCYAVYVRVFRNGTPEEYCAMRESGLFVKIKNAKKLGFLFPEEPQGFARSLRVARLDDRPSLKPSTPTPRAKTPTAICTHVHSRCRSGWAKEFR